MQLVEIKWDPTASQLRQFGVLCMIVLPLAAWVWGGGTTTVAVFASAGLLLASAGIFYPKALKPIFLVLTVAVLPIGMITGELALLLIYFAIFLPIGIVFRLLKRDALRLRLDPEKETYWLKKKQPKSISSYYRQS